MSVRESTPPTTASEKVSLPRRVLTFVSLGVIAYIVWLPVSQNQVLYPLLGLMAVVSLVLIRRFNWTWTITTATLLGLILFMWLVGDLRGNAHVNAHAFTILPTLLVWATWAAAQTPWSLKWVMRTVLLAGFVGSAGIVLMVGAESGWFPIVMPEQYVIIQNGYVDFTDTGIAIRYYGLSALAGVAPLAIAGVMLPQAKVIAPRIVFLIVAITSVSAVLVSGRRAIAVVVVLAPVLVLAITFLVARRASTFGRPAIIAAILGIGAFLVYAEGDNPIRYSIDDAIATFAPGNDLGADFIRVQQSEELLHQFGDHFLIGSGLGARLDSGFIRSDSRPWMFELQFHMMLMNGGLVVALVCAVLVFFVARRATLIARSNPEAMPYVVLAATTGAGMLIANWTNPYLIAPGHNWTIALILGVVVAFEGRAALLGVDKGDADRITSSERGAGRPADKRTRAGHHSKL